VHAVLSDSGFPRHLDALRSRLEKARRDVAFRLRGMGIEPWNEPRAGMFLWCRLPEGRDSADIARAALASNMVLAPGNAFSTSQSASAYMRFNVSQMQDERIFEVLRTIC
jgi:DNA-binding transcriptional MocR family regulator